MVPTLTIPHNVVNTASTTKLSKQSCEKSAGAGEGKKGKWKKDLGRTVRVDTYLYLKLDQISRRCLGMAQ